MKKMNPKVSLAKSSAHARDLESDGFGNGLFA